MPFSNPARKDGAVFHHWRRTADEGKEYPFAKFNKVKHLFITLLPDMTFHYY
jgi:DNA methyltransferase 1-associated protein 1